MPVSETMSSSEQVQFSSGRDRVAVSTSDGRLNIWKTGGQAPEQQFVPSNHLEAYSTCLAWAGGTQNKRKKKKEEVVVQDSSDLVAMGTSAGSVLIYSVKQGDLVTSMTKENKSKINAVLWANSGGSIFAGGEDGLVSIFSVTKLSFLSSFKTSTDPIFSVALSKDDRLLATGCRGIRLWNVASQCQVASFTGHANPVNLLRVVGDFLVSSAEDDRTMSVWSLSQEGDGLGSLLGLSVNESVRDFGVMGNGEETLVNVVTKIGNLHLFKVPPLKGTKKKKPVKPCQSLSITSGKEKETGKVQPIPILGSSLGGAGGQIELHIAYGSVLKPVLERLVVSDLKPSECLVRETPVVKLSNQQEEFNKTITPKTDGDVVFLAPGISQPVGTGKLGKRKQPSTNVGEEDSLPMEDRLSLLTTSPGGSKTPPRTDTMAQLLTQGLHGSDSRILNSVLDRADPELIDNTVRRIPAEAVVPLVTTLMKFIKGRGMVNASHAKWLRSVLTFHTGYLVSIPDCQDLLTPVYALLETRTAHYSQVMQLRGKLELLTRQTEEKEGDKVVDTTKEALLVYQDESSDELEDVIDDLLVPGSETDNDWEDEDDENDTDMEADNSDSDSVEIVNGDGDNEDEEMESD